MITIIDYGAGNLRSVELALGRIGHTARITCDPEQIAQADSLILPGVGAFGECMAALRASGVVPALLQAAQSGTPLLGICLGMQMLFDQSEENGLHEGLHLIGGTVSRLDAHGAKVPHMGWNDVTVCKQTALTAGLPEHPYLYFVHSFACRADDRADVLFTARYGQQFDAAVQRGHICGMQFHPEKSGPVGERLLANFAAMKKEVR